MYRAFPANAKFNAAQQGPNDVPLFLASGDKSPFAAMVPKMVEGLRAAGLALSRSRVLLVNREARSKTAWRKINDLGNSLSGQIPSKIAYSCPV
jgi:hypothetical protein